MVVRREEKWEEEIQEEWRLNNREYHVEVHFLDFDTEWDEEAEEEEEEEEEEEYTDWEEEIDTDFNASRGAENCATDEDKRLLNRLKAVEGSVFDIARIGYSRGAYLGE
ncbi:hypothetical protein HOY80DRAFT_1000933 [Tuber brumale]|nr:hypothetical protein HOY80DRAFT_1000933 [Tuber brumale]